ncbi:hypothetical protein Psi02_04460 [Planotetraspora silvatica]|uniref:Uncharacterized protein n=1 Tax=Planotetraspora silvatica TaxID=234614 RepID=A0A8J3UHV9_9ACTN|nr:hypothetical protein Psi02_04460 [Planotetraspora silvatica]
MLIILNVKPLHDGEPIGPCKTEQQCTDIFRVRVLYRIAALIPCARPCSHGREGNKAGLRRELSGSGVIAKGLLMVAGRRWLR